MKLAELLRLKKQQEQHQAKTAAEEARLQVKMEELKKAGFPSLKAAKDAIEEKQRQIKKCQKKLSKYVETIESHFTDD